MQQDKRGQKSLEEIIISQQYNSKQHNFQSNNHLFTTSLSNFSQLNKQFSNRKLLLLKKTSCVDRYHNELEYNTLDKQQLYEKIYSLINNMINDPIKIQQLLNTLSSLENSIKSHKNSKNNISNQSKSLSKKLSTHSQELTHQNGMVDSIKLSNYSNDQVSQNMEIINQICEGMCESIQIEAQNEDIPSQIPVFESGELLISNSIQKNLSEELENSLKIPDLSKFYQKISILLIQQSEQSSSNFYSSTSSFQSINHIDFPRVEFNRQLILAFFGEASPFLINLALSLLFKFMLKSKLKINLQNIGWILGITTVVAYKIFYDEILQGLLQYFAQALKLKFDEIIKLQRWFLNELNYEVLIDNRHYTYIMMKLLKNQ